MNHSCSWYTFENAVEYPVHHGQGDGVFNIENSVMSKTYTWTIFFSIYVYIYFFIFNREKKHEKLCLNFEPRFYAEANKGKLNYISRFPPPPRLLFHVAPLLNLFLLPKRNCAKFGPFFQSVTPENHHKPLHFRPQTV